MPDARPYPPVVAECRHCEHVVIARSSQAARAGLQNHADYMAQLGLEPARVVTKREARV